AGYGTMNEPIPGYVGWADLRKTGGIVSIGESPTGIQGMLLGSGFPQEVEYFILRKFRIAYLGKKLVNPARRSAWASGRECVWKTNGVWGTEGANKPRLLAPFHFAAVNGRPADFTDDFYRPFAARFVKAIQTAHPGCQVFMETETSRQPPHWTREEGTNVVFAPHWYDDIVLTQKELHSWLGIAPFTHAPLVGRGTLRRAYARHLAGLRQGAMDRMGGAPVLLGEFGIPFDLYHGRAYRTGDFRRQEAAIDRAFRALEDTLLSGTVWVYTPDNTNARGDGWNGEDFSIYSPDQRGPATGGASVGGSRAAAGDLDAGGSGGSGAGRSAAGSGLDAGGRALRAVVRPYPRATAGEPTRVDFDYRRGVFTLELRHDPAVTAPTEIFLPACHYGKGCSVTVSDGTWELLPDGETLLYRHDPSKPEHRVVVGRA
ncbi:MAG TPA: hypothetical protein VHE79_03350, partial [Spirochaetia bacterium]